MLTDRLEQAKTALGSGQWEMAFAICRTALAEMPDNPEALRLLGVLYAARGEFEEARLAVGRAVELDPSRALWWGDLGALQWKSGLPAAARASFGRALEMDSTLPHLAAGYCRATLRCDLLPEERWAAQWAETAPDSLQAREALAAVLKCEGKLVATLELAQAIADDHPDLYRSRLRVAAAAAELGEARQAATMCAATAALHPDFEENLSTLIYLMLFRPEFSATEIRRHCETWAGGAEELPPVPIPGDRKPDSGIHLAIPASEFTSHSAACFVTPLLRALDRTRIRVSGYNTRTTGPAGSALERAACMFRAVCDDWREVHGWSDADISAQLRRDGATAVFDISGHFQRSRLSIFRQRLAPVQLVYPNYPGTTGLTTFDALITDSWCSPPGSQVEYTEPLRRLRNGYLVYRAPDAAPVPGILPRNGNGRITFGIFQQLAKTTPGFWRAVSAILRGVPGSELIYHHALRRIDEPENAERRHVVRLLESYSIPPGRVRLVPDLPIGRHMALMSEADIALDTTPFSGQTTTFESLWMGVPIVAHSGDRHAGRITAAVCRRLGMESWVARSWDQYVNIAIEKANRVDELEQLRHALRGRLQASPLCNPNQVAGELTDLICELTEQKSGRVVTV